MNAILVLIGILLFLFWSIWQIRTLWRKPKITQPERSPELLLELIKEQFKDSGYNYSVLAKPPGDLVLVWREWLLSNASVKDYALDVMLVKKNGQVVMLGSCVEFEVFSSLEKS